MRATASLRDIVRIIDKAMMNAEAARATRDHPDSLDKRDLTVFNDFPATGRQGRPSAKIALRPVVLALDPDDVWRHRTPQILDPSCASASANRDADRARDELRERVLQLKANDVADRCSKCLCCSPEAIWMRPRVLSRKVIELDRSGGGHVTYGDLLSQRHTGGSEYVWRRGAAHLDRRSTRSWVPTMRLTA